MNVRPFLLLIAIVASGHINRLTAMNAEAQAQAKLDLAMKMIQKSGASNKELLDAKTCGICLADFTIEDNTSTKALSVLRCNPNGVPHIFHKPCLHDWVLTNPLCPMCNNDLSDLKQQIELERATELRIKRLIEAHNPLGKKNREDLKHAMVLGLANSGCRMAMEYFFKGFPTQNLIIPGLLTTGEGMALCYLQARYLPILLNKFVPGNRWWHTPAGYLAIFSCAYLIKNYTKNNFVARVNASLNK